MKKYLKIAMRVVWLGLGIFLIVSLLVFVSVQIPSVQKYLVDTVVNQLQTKTGAAVSLGSVRIHFLREVSLRHLYIGDLQGDTLLYCAEIDAGLRLWSLLYREISVEDIRLKEGKIRLRRDAGNPDFNYQFLLDAFASDAESPETPSAWTYQINAIGLHDIEISLEDALEKQNLLVQTGRIDIQSTGPPGDFSQLTFSQISLQDTDVHYTRLTGAPDAPDDEPAPEAPTTGIPRLPLDLRVDDLELAGCRIRYDDENLPRASAGWDPAHLDLSEISLEIEDLQFAEGVLALDLRQLGFREQGGFWLQNASAQFEGDSLRLDVQNLALRSAASSIDASFSLDLQALPDRLPVIAADLNDCVLAVSDIQYFFPNQSWFGENNPARIQLSGQVSGSAERLDIEQFRASAPGLLLDVSGRLAAFTLDDQRSVEIRLHELSGDYAALHSLAPGLPLAPAAARLGKVLLRGNVSGQMNNISLDSLVLKTESQTHFLIGGRVQNLTSPDSLRYVGEVFSLRTSYADLKGLLPGQIPSQLAGLGLLSYEGLLRGSRESLSLNGLLRSAAGPLVAKFTTRFPVRDSLIGYEGFLGSAGWDLGVLAGDSAGLGAIAFELEVNGRGFDPQSMEAQIVAQVHSLQSGSYVFRNFEGKAEIRDQIGTAAFSLSDPNLSAAFFGEIDFHDSLPAYDITAAIDTANLLVAGLLNHDLRGSMRFRLEGQGSRPGDFVGSAVVSDLRLQSEKLRYEENELRIVSQKTGPNRQRLEVDSDVLRIRLEGQYHLGELPASLLAFLDPYFREKQALAAPPDSLMVEKTGAPPQRVISPQQWEIEVHLHDAAELAQILVPDLIHLDSAYLDGRYDSENQILEFQGKVPKLAYGSSAMENIELSISGNLDDFSGTFTSDTARYSSRLTFPATQLQARLLAGHILLDLGLEGDSLRERFAVHADIFRKDTLTYLHLDTPLVFEYEDWDIGAQNQVAFDSAYLAVEELVFRKGEQEIKISSEIQETGQPPLRLDFSQFDVSEVNSLTGDSDWQLGGEMNGYITVYDLFDSPLYGSEIRASDLVLNAAPFGDLYVNMGLESVDKVISIYAEVTGDYNQLALAGAYRLGPGELYARGQIGRLSMKFLEGFVPDLIHDSQGQIEGEFTLSGPATLPRIDGELTLNEVETRIRYTGAKYRADSEKLLLEGNTIRFSDVQLRDTLGNVADVKGLINYSQPENMRYNLDINSNRFLVLNTRRGADPLYYGNIFLSMNAQLQGTSQRPELNARASTLAGTHLVTIPLGIEEEVRQESYIVFGKPPDLLKAEGEERETMAMPTATAAVNMDLKLQLTRDAQLEVIIDPISGDKIVCQGDADLLVLLNRSGDISVIGSYVIDKGSYDFSYQNLLKKKFSVQKGSSINFPGDPLQAAIDITAVYETRTSTYELISSQATALSDEELRQARQKVPAEALLKLGGVLFQPVITFDIRLPESQQSVLSSAVERKLSEIRQDDSEMSKQVFGLLLFNSFLMSDRSAGLALGTAGGEAALSSLSNLITNQLNNLASRYVKGVDISIGLDTYAAGDQGGLSNRVTDMQLGVSKQLLDDRLSISVGGNMSMNNETNNPTLQNEAFTQFTGDFVIEYKLTEKGRYRVKVFSKSDYDILNGSNVNKTGVGLYFRESFDKLGAKKRARENEQSARQ